MKKVTIAKLFLLSPFILAFLSVFGLSIYMLVKPIESPVEAAGRVSATWSIPTTTTLAQCVDPTVGEIEMCLAGNGTTGGNLYLSVNGGAYTPVGGGTTAIINGKTCGTCTIGVTSTAPMVTLTSPTVTAPLVTVTVQ